jgi:hypothetical protein
MALYQTVGILGGIDGIVPVVEHLLVSFPVISDRI